MQQYFASTSGVQNARPAFVLQGVHQSSLAYSSDLRVRGALVFALQRWSPCVKISSVSRSAVCAVSSLLSFLRAHTRHFWRLMLALAL